MSRRERRAQELTERKREKKLRKETGGDAPLDALARARAEQAAASADRDPEWLAGLLPKQEGEAALVLEVGTTGASTRALAARGFRVAAIDENPAALERAARLVPGAKTIARGRAHAVSPTTYAIDYAKPPESLDTEVTLIEADPIAEPALGDALVYAGPFDVVTVSADGAHAARFANAALVERGVRDANRYRGEIFKRAYELADKVLYSDGVLQIVHVVEGDVTEDRAREVVRLHAELARGTALRFDRMDVKDRAIAVLARKT